MATKSTESTRTDLDLAFTRTIVRHNGDVIVWRLYRYNYGSKRDQRVCVAYLPGMSPWETEFVDALAMQPNTEMAHDSGWIRVRTKLSVQPYNRRREFSHWYSDTDFQYNR